MPLSPQSPDLSPRYLVNSPRKHDVELANATEAIPTHCLFLSLLFEFPTERIRTGVSGSLMYA